MSFGIGFWLIVGAGLGILIDDIAIGAGVGMLFGITIGTVLDYNKRENKLKYDNSLIFQSVPMRLTGAIIV